jgi:hypothetical protein
MSPSSHIQLSNTQRGMVAKHGTCIAEKLISINDLEQKKKKKKRKEILVPVVKHWQRTCIRCRRSILNLATNISNQSSSLINGLLYSTTCRRESPPRILRKGICPSLHKHPNALGLQVAMLFPLPAEVCLPFCLRERRKERSVQRIHKSMVPVNAM